MHCLTNEKTIPNHPMMISLITFIMSLLWIWFVANVLIDLLKVIGLLFNIPDTFLGITVLTFGNSVCDLALNVSLVKGGYGEMALAGSLGGPIFNLLFGLGSSLLKINLLYGTIEISFYKKENLISVIAVFCLILNLVRLLVQSYCVKYKFNKSVAIVGFILYFLFLIAICLITFIF